MMKTRSTRHARLAAVLLTALAVLVPAAAAAQTAQAQYTAAKTRDDAVRGQIAAVAADAPAGVRTPVITEARAVIAAYQALVRRFRASGYSDNALFNAASLAEALHGQFALTTDLDTALRLYRRLADEYPTAPLTKDAAVAVARLEPVAAAQAPVSLNAERVAEGAVTPAVPERRAVPRRAAASTPGRARLTAIERTVLPELVRVTLALDREVAYHEEVLKGPARVFFDFTDVEAAAPLADAVLRYPSEVVRQIRVGRHPNAIRVVLDLEGVARHSVYTLYNPFRVVIDAESRMPADKAPVRALVAGAPVAAPLPAAAAPSPVAAAPATRPAPPAARPMPAVTLSEDKAVVASAPTTDSTVATAPATVAPIAPNVNTAGGFSIARQLGLGVSRIVIDPGHGGHDPGATSKGTSEAELTLDIALRLEQLLLQEPGLEVVLTRREDVYIPLEERTAIANREGADLFLSIHANTSRVATARGVETYFLSFAASADAEAVAARENSAHAGEMHKLPDMIRAITLNNKLDESRDLAAMVQEALVTRLRRANKTVMNRGVKKAPFVVLIGAEMPSVLAEVSFMSNKQEAQLLKTPAYKQRIAEALHAAVMRYRRSLKGVSAVATQSEPKD